MAALNQQRAADRQAQIITAAQTEAGPMPMPPGPEEIPELDPAPSGPLVDPEMERLRQHYLDIIEEHRFLKSIQAPHFPSGKPIISKPLPPNYVVWLGPEPPTGVQLCMSSRGRVKAIPRREEFTMVDGGGHGKTRTVSGTTHGGLTTEYIDNGFTSIEFDDRCPPNHKYAGRLYARIDCPEHAAYLQLTAGKDREGHQLFVWFLVAQFKSMYDQLKRSHMRKKELETVEVEDVMSHGNAMPVDA